MVDAVYAGIAATETHADWRATVVAIAHRTRDAALTHEWFADLLGGRPHLGPHALAVGEATAAALDRAPGISGLDDLQRALGALDAFMIGAVRREVTERRTARSTGTDLTAWQTGLGPYLTRMLDTGRYPTVARLVVDGAHLDARESFDHNLAVVIDGVTGRRLPVHPSPHRIVSGLEPERDQCFGSVSQVRVAGRLGQPVRVGHPDGDPRLRLVPRPHGDPVGQEPVQATHPARLHPVGDGQQVDPERPARPSERDERRQEVRVRADEVGEPVDHHEKARQRR
ncbi:TetR/AcrR family transcriptional regulator C-terminal domain-containing protein [Stackebrandtia albiflava]